MITPEDIMYGWDPLKEDHLLGFKKLPTKDTIISKNWKQNKKALEGKDWHPEAIRYRTTGGTIEDFIVDTALALERDGYHHFDDYRFPPDFVMVAVKWATDWLLEKGLITTKEANEHLEEFARNFK